MLVDRMFMGGLVTDEIEYDGGFAGVSIVIFIVALHGKILVI